MCKTKHLSVRDAAYEAGLRRMRPIFLTSATTALGVMPMIIAHTSLWMPMGVVICYGTIFTLPLTVTILPVMYWKLMGKRPSKSPLKGDFKAGKSVQTISKHLLTLLLCLLCCLPVSANNAYTDSVVSIDEGNLSTPSLCREGRGGSSIPSLCREGRGGSSLSPLKGEPERVSEQERVLTLDSCLALARRNNPELRKAALEVEKAKQVKQQAFTNYFPQVSA